jgi:hypothetical protein
MPTVPPQLTPWEPGQSGNPGGKSSEQKRREMRAAELATMLRLAELEAQAKALEAGTLPGVTGDNLRMWKDAEERGLGAPTQTIEANVGVKKITRRKIEHPAVED